MNRSTADGMNWFEDFMKFCIKVLNAERGGGKGKKLNEKFTSDTLQTFG